MNQTSHFGYTETPSAQILEMRYAGTGIAFDVLLSRTLSGLPGLEKSLTLENLSGWLGKLTTRNVQVSLPKFRAESAFSLDLRPSRRGPRGRTRRPSRNSSRRAPAHAPRGGPFFG